MVYLQMMMDQWPITILALVLAVIIGYLTRTKYVTVKDIQEHLEKALNYSDEEFIKRLKELKVYRTGWITLDGNMGWLKVNKKLMGRLIARIIEIEPDQIDKISESVVNYYIKVWATKWIPRYQQSFVEGYVDDLRDQILEQFDRYQDRWLRGQICQGIDAALGVFVNNLRLEEESKENAKIIAQAERAYKAITAPPLWHRIKNIIPEFATDRELGQKPAKANHLN